MPAPEEGAASAAASESVSKKAAQKAAKKAERQAMAAAKASPMESEEDPLSGNYGDVKLVELQASAADSRKWVEVRNLGSELSGQLVWVRGRAHSTRGKGKIAFLVLRQSGYTVQCVASVEENIVSKQMIKWISSLNRESIVDVQGEVSIPDRELSGTTQQVELRMRKVFCVGKAELAPPFTLEDAARSEEDFRRAEEEGLQYVRVLQDTRLNNRVIDLRTPANQAIFRVESWVSTLFRQFFLEQDFMEIHTPKLMAGASEGGASVFRSEYFGKPACLAQSPQLHKQMSISADFERVFEIGPVFRAENSYTHRHLCEFTGLDFEMEIKSDYMEVVDLVCQLFMYIFDGLNKHCSRELSHINQQYPFEPLEYLKDTLKLSFKEGIEMLKEAGFEVDPLGDLNTETERRLGQLVKEKYKTDFYILYRYPLAVRPFYTMPAADDPNYSNSFDVFIRGEEIISGAQRVHDVTLLSERATQCGIDLKSISAYLDSFRYGTPPHGGAGVGLERVVMLFCGLNNIRKVSLFPRDPQRLAP